MRVPRKWLALGTPQCPIADHGTMVPEGTQCGRRHCGEVRWLYVVQPGNSVDAAMAEALGVVCQYYSDVCDCDWQEVPR